VIAAGLAIAVIAAVMVWLHFAMSRRRESRVMTSGGRDVETPQSAPTS